MAVLAVTQAPKAQAQEESYITDAAEAAACASVCNTFVPPQTEQECRTLYWERWEEEYLRNFDALIRLANRQQAELETSHDIYYEEWIALKAVNDERVAIARAVATRIAGAISAYAACLASITVTGPAAITAAAICPSLYASACAGFIVTMNREFKDAGADFARDNRIAREDWKIETTASLRSTTNERQMKTLGI